MNLRLVVMVAALAGAAMSQVAVKPGATPDESEWVVVKLKTMTPSSGPSIRWSPKANACPLTVDGAALVGEFELGPEGSKAVRVRLEQSEKTPQHDVLCVDLDRDGEFAADERFTCTPTERRGKWWSSWGGAVVKVPTEDGERDAEITLWYVRMPDEPEQPHALRFTRRHWMQGTATLGGVDAVVVLAESVFDGIYDRRDAYALAPVDDLQTALSSSRPLTDHNWLGEKAWQVMAWSPDGDEIALAPCEPGVTRAEEVVQRDKFLVDKRAKRSGKEVSFGHDYEAAQKAAKKDGKRILVDFTTTWCGPCKAMKRMVWNTDDVVAAAMGMVAVEVDGDARRDLVKRFEVEGYPTILLLDSDGNVLARRVGYQSVADTVILLQRDAK